MRSSNGPDAGRAAALLLILAVAGCARTGGYGASAYDGAVPYDGTDPAAGQAPLRAPGRYYPPPGPPNDPWGPYIQEAAKRYRVPDQWVRAVMHQESGGREQAVSPVGAMGLMQVMPATYAGLRTRHRLGDDPYDPHNNILAGTAYIREMYDRYGAPGFLAAYNAGPDRLDQYLTGASPLPDETVNYLAAIAPNLGSDVPLSGPLAEFAQGQSPQGQATATVAPPPDVASLAAGCDPNAAYDPDHPCAPLELAASAPATPPVVPVSLSALASSPSALGAFASGWGIQVGAFQSEGLARAVAEGARVEAPDQLGGATVAVPTAPSGGAPLYRARLLNLSAGAAQAACQRLNQRQLACTVVRPEES
jgi:D-alanyl-D-alanine carboxypeptidase